MSFGKLVSDIQELAVSSESNICDLLRLCQILGHQIKLEEMVRWAEYELGGYPKDEDVPDYRVIKGQAYGNFHDGYGRQIQNAPIPATALPENLQFWCREAKMRIAISSLVDSVSEGDGDHLAISWPHELAMTYGSRVLQNCECLGAWLSIPRPAIIGLIDAVRNRVLKFILEIDGEFDGDETEGEVGGLSDITPVEFQTIIYGSVGNLAVNSQDVHQEIVNSVITGNFDSVSKVLENLGIEKNEIDDLEEALRNDDDSGVEGKIGPETAGWMAKIIQKAATGAYKVGVGGMGALLGQLLANFLGIPGS